MIKKKYIDVKQEVKESNKHFKIGHSSCQSETFVP